MITPQFIHVVNSGRRPRLYVWCQAAEKVLAPIGVVPGGSASADAMVESRILGTKLLHAQKITE